MPKTLVVKLHKHLTSKASSRKYSWLYGIAQLVAQMSNCNKCLSRCLWKRVWLQLISALFGRVTHRLWLQSNSNSLKQSSNWFRRTVQRLSWRIASAKQRLIWPKNSSKILMCSKQFWNCYRNSHHQRAWCAIASWSRSVNSTKTLKKAKLNNWETLSKLNFKSKEWISRRHLHASMRMVTVCSPIWSSRWFSPFSISPSARTNLGSSSIWPTRIKMGRLMWRNSTGWCTLKI